MLSHPTFELLRGLGLHGMADGYKSLETNPEAGSLTHAEWLALQLRFCAVSESVRHHDSEIMGWREPRSRRRLNYGPRRCGM